MAGSVKAFDLKSTFVVLHPDQSATPVNVTPTIFNELNDRFDDFRERWLFSTFTFRKDWSTREMHPAGDEIVLLLSGNVELILEQDGRRRSVRLSDPGSYVVVPRGTWHTAKTKVPTKMLFITPGRGTQNEPV